MFKIDKSTHMLILFTFALVFVVVYLYYTITDLRKMQKEVKRLTDELAALKAGTGANAKVQVLSPAAAAVPAPQPSPPVGAQQAKVVVKQLAPEPVADDASSVASDEIREALKGSDDEDEKPAVAPVPSGAKEEEGDGEEQEDAEINIEDLIAAPAAKDATGEAATEITLDILGKMKYEDLREYCRKHGLSQKGNKDVLMSRIAATLTPA